MLHMNELPFRKLFIKIDGCTSGPDRFTELIGKLITKKYNLPIVNFQIIEIDEHFTNLITRKQRPETSTPGTFNVPNINVDASEYHLMIDEDEWYELVDIPTYTLLLYTIDITIFKFALCHSQSVERHIQLGL